MGLRWSRPGRLIVNVALIVAVAALVALGYSVSRRQEGMARAARQAQDLARAAQQVKYRAADFNGWQNAYALDIARALPGATDDESAGRSRFLDSSAKFRNEMAVLESLPASPEIKRAVADVRKAFLEFMSVDREAVRLYRAGGAADRSAAADLVVGRENAIYVRIAEGAEFAADRSVSDADAEFTRLESVGVATRRYLVGLSVIATALAATGVALARARRRAAAEHARQVERMAGLGQLAGGIAHDFNNLLGIILNYTEFVAECVPGEARDDLTRIRTAAERAAGLTTQLLVYIRQDTVRAEIVDVNAAVAETHAILARTIGEHIELVVRPAPVPLTVRVDAGQLQQILVNLAVNARDAMPDGGTLSIAAAAVDLGEKRANLRPAVKAGRYLELLVSDTGTGMPPETVARIFEPFFTTKPKGHGTGLGLATVYGIIAAAGGSVDVCSEPGHGTMFRVYFPIVDAPQGDRSEPASVPAPHGAGERILVVEDEPVLGAGIGRILATGGYQVRFAVSGSEAVDVYRRDKCDLLVTDVVMPEMSGPRLTEILHRIDPRLPVLYISGYDLDADQRLEPGTHLLEKPFSADELLAAVGVILAEVHTRA